MSGKLTPVVPQELDRALQTAKAWNDELGALVPDLAQSAKMLVDALAQLGVCAAGLGELGRVITDRDKHLRLLHRAYKVLDELIDARTPVTVALFERADALRALLQEYDDPELE